MIYQAIVMTMVVKLILLSVQLYHYFTVIRARHLPSESDETVNSLVEVNIYA